MIIPELNEFVNSYIIYIDNQQKNDIVKNFSIPSGNLPLIKNIFELKHSNSFEIQDIEDIKKYTNIFMETLIEVCQRHQTSIYIDDIKYIEKYLAELENGGN